MLGVDYKSIENALVPGIDSIATPIRYLPWTRRPTRAPSSGPRAITTVNLGTDFHFAGTIECGGSKEDFQINRGGVKDNNVVDGNYVIYHLDFDTTIRLPGLLTTMAQGRFIELPAPDASFEDDATLVAGFSGQYAERAARERRAVPARRPLQRARATSRASASATTATTSRSSCARRALKRFLGGYLGEKIQALAVLRPRRVLPALETQDERPRVDDDGRLQGVGVGLRASFLETPYGRLRGEAYLGLPTIETEDTKRTPRLFFQVKADF